MTEFRERPSVAEVWMHAYCAATRRAFADSEQVVKWADRAAQEYDKRFGPHEPALPGRKP